MKIGFIGLGSMGGKQARELTKHFKDVAVFDAFPQMMTPFEGKARIATSVADVATDADSVGICVRDDAQVLECIADLLPVMKPGSVLLIHSTVRPATMVDIAARAAASQIAVIDAAVTRTEMHDDGPFVFCMTAGDEAVAARVRPVIDAYATDTLHIGALGSAMALKITNNLVSWSEIMIGLEAMELAEAAGVPRDKLLTIMQRNGVMTPPMKGFIGLRNMDDKSDDIRTLIRSQAGIGKKDLSLAEELAQGVGGAVPITAHIRDMVQGYITDLADR